VVEQQNANRLPSYTGHQLPFHRFFGHQSHRPSGATPRRIAADHGDDSLFLVGIKYLARARPLLLIQSTIQPGLFVTMAQSADGLRSEGDHLGNLRRTGIFSQLQQR
jgi:hypothetical protein